MIWHGHISFYSKEEVKSVKVKEKEERGGESLLTSSVEDVSHFQNEVVWRTQTWHRNKTETQTHRTEEEMSGAFNR